MIVLAGALLGAVLGGRNARAQQGSRADIAQYATAGAIAGGLLAFILAIALERLLT